MSVVAACGGVTLAAELSSSCMLVTLLMNSAVDGSPGARIPELCPVTLTTSVFGGVCSGSAAWMS